MSINLKAPSATVSSMLVADTVNQNSTNGSPDCIAQPTKFGGSAASAALEIQSTKGGLLIPRMTTVQIGLLNSGNAMMVYDSTLNVFKFYQNGSYVEYTTGGPDVGYSAGHPTYLQDTFNLAANNLSMGTLPAHFGAGTSISIFGDSALLANDTGINLTGMGFGVLQANFNGEDNSAFGYLCLTNNTAGDYNSGFGSNCLSANLGGVENSAFGFSALEANLTDYCNAFGANAGKANTLGSVNAFGTAAAYQNTTGSVNAFGQEALFSNIDGANNCAFGASACHDIVSGSSNCTFGDQSNSVSESSNGSSFGFQSLNINADGNSNSAFGYKSGAFLVHGDSNSFFGDESGGTIASTLDLCSFFGAAAQADVSGLTNATAIGANAVVSISNALVLGDVDAPTKVGIGTSSPANILHTVGLVQFQGIASGTGFDDSGIVKAQYGITVADSASGFIDFPVDPVFSTTYISATIVGTSPGGENMWGTVSMAAYWNGAFVLPSYSGAPPDVVFYGTSADTTATWTTSGNNLRLTINNSIGGGDTITFVVSIERYTVYP